MQKEQEFFKYIADAARVLVSGQSMHIVIANHKKDGDFATVVDLAVEELIVAEIKKRFPDDKILAEETAKDTEIDHGRIWIIDPICGTNNLARGIKNFCTNIALSENNRLIASCVIDYSQNEYYWSVGDGKVFINDTVYEPSEKYDVVVEVDFGAVFSVNNARKEKHNRFIKKLVLESNYYLISLNTSLSFAYVAIGKVDGVVNIYSNPWDICASIFLIQQSGGTVTAPNGEAWQITTVGMIAGKNEEIHKKLLDTYMNC